MQSIGETQSRIGIASLRSIWQRAGD